MGKIKYSTNCCQPSLKVFKTAPIAAPYLGALLSPWTCRAWRQFDYGRGEGDRWVVWSTKDKNHRNEGKLFSLLTRVYSGPVYTKIEYLKGVPIYAKRWINTWCWWWCYCAYPKNQCNHVSPKNKHKVTGPFTSV